jgi:hypothetical protein
MGGEPLSVDGVRQAKVALLQAGRAISLREEEVIEWVRLTESLSRAGRTLDEMASPVIN